MTAHDTVLPPPAVTTDVPALAARVRRAQRRWSGLPISERVRRVKALWTRLRSAQDELAAAVRRETGKPRAEIDVLEWAGVELIVKYFTRNAARALEDRAAARPWIFANKRAYVRRVPRGVVGLIAPWNYPLLIPLGDAIPALLAGNGLILKPSQWTPETGRLLARLIQESGLFPEDLVSVAEGGAAAGEAVVRACDMVLFTGSTRTGRAVARAAAERLIPCVLELGGKHPMIVLDDAPLDRAAKAAVWGGFVNAGQTCVGVERVYVDRRVYAPFAERVEREVRALRLAAGDADSYDVGPVMLEAQLAAIAAQLADARERGGRVIGGRVMNAERRLLEPALVLDATAEMRVMREETFGPVLPVMPVADAEEAVRLANDSELGLAASVWSRNLARAERLGARLEAGLVGVNDVLGHYAICSLPFGGVKQSGLGRRNSEEGLRMFCQAQSFVVHRWPANIGDPWWFPYSDRVARVVARLTRVA